MDLGPSRLEALSRVQESPPDPMDREQRRARRAARNPSPDDEEELGSAEEGERHQLDDVV